MIIRGDILLVFVSQIFNTKFGENMGLLMRRMGTGRMSGLSKLLFNIPFSLRRIMQSNAAAHKILLFFVSCIFVKFKSLVNDGEKV
jgi:hypothetical protein